MTSIPSLSLRALCAAASLFALCGCFNLEPPGESLQFRFETTGRTAIGRPCDQALDCPLGQVCISNVCQDGCLSSADCPPGQACEGTPPECVSIGSCTSDADCTPSEPVCHPTFFECVSCLQSTDCPGDLICSIDTSCASGIRECTPEDFVCSGCSSDLDCTLGGFCNENSGQCVECLVDDHCPNGLVCDPERSFCAPCAKDEDCTEDIFRPVCMRTEESAVCVGCEDDSDCLEGTCDQQTLTCQGCLAQSDCGSPELTCNPASGLCYDTTCALTNGPLLLELTPSLSIPVPELAGPLALATIRDNNGNGVPDAQDQAEILIPSNPPNASSPSLRVRDVGGSSIWTSSGTQGATLGVAVGNLNDGALPEVVALRGERLVAHDAFGSTLWTSSSRTQGLPNLFDVDQDSYPEIVSGGSLFSEAGARVWRGEAHQGSHSNLPGIGFAADLRPDLAGLEVIAGGTVYSALGETLCSQGEDGFSTLADLNNDGAPEILVVSGDGTLRALTSECALLWGPIQPNTPAPTQSGGRPLAVDLFGDAHPEILYVSSSSTLTLLSWEGDILWNAPLDNAHPASAATAADLDDDGTPEILVSDAAQLRLLRPTDAFLLTSHPDGASTLAHGSPLLADIDSDGVAEIVVASKRQDQEDAVVVFQDVRDRWTRTRNVWNQSYYIAQAIGDDLNTPTVLPAWWTQSNAHIQPTQGTARPAPNLLIKRVVESERTDQCPDRYTVSVSVINRGSARVEQGVLLDARFTGVDVGSLLQVQTRGAIPPGGEETLDLTFSDLRGPVDIQITASRQPEREALNPECNEDDNIILLEGIGCNDLPQPDTNPNP